MSRLRQPSTPAVAAARCLITVGSLSASSSEKPRSKERGFAVPAADVVQFLAKSATTQGAAGQLRRDWVNAKGNRSIDGVYLGHSGQNLKLLLPSKKTLEVEFKYLSANDREFLKLLKESK